MQPSQGTLLLQSAMRNRRSHTKNAACQGSCSATLEPGAYLKTVFMLG